MATELTLGCCGWNYGDRFEEGGWVGSFYPNSKTKRLPYYSSIFPAVEFDAIFYEKFYSKMGRGTFNGMINATPDNFEFSVKVPERITHEKRLSLSQGAYLDFQEYLERISPLKEAGKLGAILIQLPPSFTVKEFRNVEDFLERLPRGYDFALEFRHPSWATEGPWELLSQHNVATVITDSPDPKLRFLSDVTITADHVFVRLHGRKKGYWYDYLYSEEELKPWVAKIKKIQKDAKVRHVRVMFNNHAGGKAVVNALQFKKEMAGTLDEKEKDALARTEAQVSGKKSGLESWMTK